MTVWIDAAHSLSPRESVIAVLGALLAVLIGAWVTVFGGKKQ